MTRRLVFTRDEMRPIDKLDFLRNGELAKVAAYKTRSKLNRQTHIYKREYHFSLCLTCFLFSLSLSLSLHIHIELNEIERALNWTLSNMYELKREMGMLTFV